MGRGARDVKKNCEGGDAHCAKRVLNVKAGTCGVLRRRGHAKKKEKKKAVRTKNSQWEKRVLKGYSIDFWGNEQRERCG